MMPPFSFKTIFDPSEAITGAIEHGFKNFIVQAAGSKSAHEQKLSIIAENENKEMIGGIYGDLAWDWLYVRTFWVHEDYRGKRTSRDGSGEALCRFKLHQWRIDTAVSGSWTGTDGLFSRTQQ